MTFAETQQATWQNAQGPGNTHQPGGFGQPAFGQYGGQNTAGYGAPGWWGQTGINQSRQLTPHDVNEVIRQLAPLLPQIVAQAQQPGFQAAYGFGQHRSLTQQDVNEIVRQILPMVPQLVGSLQGQGQGGNFGQQGFGQQGFGQQGFGGGPQFQAMHGGAQNHMQRQLGQQDLQEVVRQLIAVLPQAIGNLQQQGLQRQF